MGGYLPKGVYLVIYGICFECFILSFTHVCIILALYYPSLYYLSLCYLSLFHFSSIVVLIWFYLIFMYSTLSCNLCTKMCFINNSILILILIILIIIIIIINNYKSA